MINIQWMSFFSLPQRFLVACTNKQVIFFINVQNMAWLAKGGPLNIILCAFYRQKVLVAWQRIYVASIMKCVVIASEGFSKLTIFLGFFVPFFFNTLLATSEGSKNMILFLWPLVTHPKILSLGSFFSHLARCFV